MRLRRYIAVVVYFAGFFAVVDLHQREVITSEIPSVLFAVFGFAWLFAFIWRNRAGTPEGITVDRNSDWADLNPYNPTSATYYTSGPGSSEHGSRTSLD